MTSQTNTAPDGVAYYEFGVTFFRSREAAELALENSLRMWADCHVSGPTTGRGGDLVWTAHADDGQGTTWAL